MEEDDSFDLAERSPVYINFKNLSFSPTKNRFIPQAKRGDFSNSIINVRNRRHIFCVGAQAVRIEILQNKK